MFSEFEHPFRTFQYQIVDTFGDNYFHWLFDSKGGTGKTTFADWLEDNYQCVRISANTITSVIKRQILEKDELKCIFFDLFKKPNASFYELLEEIKDRKIQYREQTYNIPPVKVWVFASGLPKFSDISPHKWVVWKVDTDIKDQETLDYQTIKPNYVYNDVKLININREEIEEIIVKQKIRFKQIEQQLRKKYMEPNKAE